MMRKKLSLIYYFFIFSMIFNFTLYPAYGETKSNSSLIIADSTNRFNNSLIIAERDVLSFYILPNSDTTANLTPIIFHEAWIINNDNQSKNITVYNSIPKKNYKKVFRYPFFGKRALMPQSMIPAYFNPKSTKVLDEPMIIEGRDEINYTWNNVKVDPMEAVIVAYANYYEDGSEIYRQNIIDLPSVSITRFYDSYDSLYIMNYTLKNTGALRLHAPKFILFFPEKVNGTQLIEPSNVSVSSLCKTDIFENTSYNDGTGYFSNGHMVLSHCPEYLESNGLLNFLIEVKGKVENSGKLIPSLVIGFKADSDLSNKTGQMMRIWPETKIISEETINVSRFYYYETSLAIPENKFFVVAPSKFVLPDILMKILIFTFIFAVIFISARKRIVDILNQRVRLI